MKSLSVTLIGLAVLTLPASSTAQGTTPKKPMHITLKIGTQTMAATLQDSAASRDFVAQLPLTLKMTELNGNEKYAELPAPSPTAASNPGTIHAGDLMLYGSRTLVLFYKTFPTFYVYTRLGRVDNPASLAKALGTGQVTVTITRNLAM